MGVLQESGWASSSGAEEIPPARPAMVMGIAHESACVWDLKWCPSRTSTWDLPQYTPLSISEADAQGEELPRLGLLAAAFADGSVKIFSVPHPASLTRGILKPSQSLSLSHLTIFPRSSHSPGLCKAIARCRVQALCQQRYICELVPSRSSPVSFEWLF